MAFDFMYFEFPSINIDDVGDVMNIFTHYLNETGKRKNKRPNKTIDWTKRKEKKGARHCLNQMIHFFCFCVFIHCFVVG